MEENTWLILKYGYPDPGHFYMSFHPRRTSTQEIIDYLEAKCNIKDGQQFLIDVYPGIVEERKVLKSGPNKGQERIRLYPTMEVYQKDIIVKKFFGVDTLNELNMLSNLLNSNYYDVLETTASESIKKKPDRDLFKEIAYKWNWYVCWKRDREILNKCNAHYKNISCHTVYPEPEAWAMTANMTDEEILGLDRDLISVKNIGAIVKAFTKLVNLVDSKG